jgi:hypothetical protein
MKVNKSRGYSLEFRKIKNGCRKPIAAVKGQPQSRVLATAPIPLGSRGGIQPPQRHLEEGQPQTVLCLDYMYSVAHLCQLACIVIELSRSLSSLN